MGQKHAFWGVLLSLFFMIGFPALAQEEESAEKTTVNSGIDGTTTVTTIQLEPAIQAYKSSAESAQFIVTKLMKLAPKPTHVLVTASQNPRGDFWIYEATNESLADLNETYKTLLKISIPAIPRREKNADSSAGGLPATLADTTAALKSVTDFLSFFKGNTTLEGTSVELDTEAVMAQFFMVFEVTPSKPIVFYDGYGPNVANALESALVLSFENRRKARKRIADPAWKRQKGRLEKALKKNAEDFKPFLNRIDDAEKALAKARNADDKAKIKYWTEVLRGKGGNDAGLYGEKKAFEAEARAINAALKTINDMMAKLKETNKLQAELSAKLDTFEEKSGKRLVDRLAAAARLAPFFDKPKAGEKRYIVYFKPVKAGGTARTVRNAFNSGSVSFSGGSIMTFAIAEATTGTIERGGLLRSISKYQRINDGSRYIDESESIKGDGTPKNVITRELRSRPRPKEWKHTDGPQLQCIDTL